MTLAATQSAFMAHLLDEETAFPAGWGEKQQSGLAVYRNNYRSSLIDALSETFERTARWVGAQAFHRAAAHHVITSPPSSWSLDHACAGFHETCAELFSFDPEVAELAWLEWTMLEVFTTEDSKALTAQGFGRQSAGFSEADWGNLRLTFTAGATAHRLKHDLKPIWEATGNVGELPRPEVTVRDCGCLVSREGERPTFLIVDTEEAEAFSAMQNGVSFGEICAMLAGADLSPNLARDAAQRAGAMLGRWISEGLVGAIAT